MLYDSQCFKPYEKYDINILPSINPKSKESIINSENFLKKIDNIVENTNNKTTKLVDIDEKANDEVLGILNNLSGKFLNYPYVNEVADKFNNTNLSIDIERSDVPCINNFENTNKIQKEGLNDDINTYKNLLGDGIKVQEENKELNNIVPEILDINQDNKSQNLSKEEIEENIVFCYIDEENKLHVNLYKRIYENNYNCENVVIVNGTVTEVVELSVSSIDKNPDSILYKTTYDKVGDFLKSNYKSICARNNLNYKEDIKYLNSSKIKQLEDTLISEIKATKESEHIFKYRDKLIEINEFYMKIFTKSIFVSKRSLIKLQADVLFLILDGDYIRLKQILNK